ncbi:hypothetical protein [Prevotella sp. E13-27]|uniref:hypothetical protein n=1 Tax=Prevotella sp. E13-27 TaxID=2938122 RepID=UPI00200A2815|nr:hypothetical protein [Prevotella sp. E13-27]MCK8622194.1 hypothetical protein [Prevotella sp. E13-27]
MLLFASIATWAQGDVVRAEYFLDTDPGHGKAQSVECRQVGENQLVFDLGQAAAGAHILFIRTQDSQGRWSTTISRPLYVISLKGRNVARAEYFLDTDPGYGKARSVECNQVGENQLVFDLSQAAVGAHILFIRTQDTLGRWSTAMSRPLYVCPLEGIAQVEYFIDDADPGVGKATQVVVSDPKAETIPFVIDIDALSEGDHQLSVRVKSHSGTWSMLTTQSFNITICTGIRTIVFNDSAPAKRYNLRGQSANNGTPHSEIYIQNGKKYFDKNKK